MSSNPVQGGSGNVRVIRTPDFSETGEYAVFLGETEIGRIYRDPESGHWMDADLSKSSKSAFPPFPLGYTKQEAVAKMVAKHTGPAASNPFKDFEKTSLEVGTLDDLTTALAEYTHRTAKGVFADVDEYETGHENKYLVTPEDTVFQMWGSTMHDSGFEATRYSEYFGKKPGMPKDLRAAIQEGWLRLDMTPIGFFVETNGQEKEISRIRAIAKETLKKGAIGTHPAVVEYRHPNYAFAMLFDGTLEGLAGFQEPTVRGLLGRGGPEAPWTEGFSVYENPLDKVPRRFRPHEGAAKRELGQLFAQNWDALVRRVDHPPFSGTAWLPKHKVTSGQLWLFPELAVADPPLARRLGREYGCGYYGCVYQTSVPGVVFKITTDPTEARFIQVLIEMQLNNAAALPGMTEFYGVYELSGSIGGHDGLPVTAWAIWREESSIVGLPEIKKAAQRKGYFGGSAVQNDLDAVHGFLMGGYGQKASSASQSSLEAFLAEDLMMSRRRGWEMRALMGETMFTLAEHGLALMDAHYENVGLVQRPKPWNWLQPVITDPGHARFLVSTLKDIKPPLV